MPGRPKIPSYRLHKPSGKAVVTLSGEDLYLGPYGTEVSGNEFDRVIKEWLVRNRSPSLVRREEVVTVGEVVGRCAAAPARASSRVERFLEGGSTTSTPSARPIPGTAVVAASLLLLGAPLSAPPLWWQERIKPEYAAPAELLVRGQSDLLLRGGQVLEISSPVANRSRVLPAWAWNVAYGRAGRALSFRRRVLALSIIKTYTTAIQISRTRSAHRRGGRNTIGQQAWGS